MKLLGDALSDMDKENRAYHSFIDKIPKIEKMLSDIPFYELTERQHDEAYRYWRYKRDELIRQMESAINNQYSRLMDDHWDVSVGNHKRMKGWKAQAHHIPIGIKLKDMPKNTVEVDGS
jgi:hypothetical protein